MNDNNNEVDPAYNKAIEGEVDEVICGHSGAIPQEGKVADWHEGESDDSNDGEGYAVEPWWVDADVDPVAEVEEAAAPICEHFCCGKLIDF